MDKYINIKVVEAEEMYRREAVKQDIISLPPNFGINDVDNDYGYHFIDEYGVDHWLIANKFEAKYKPLNPLLETAIQMNSNDYRERFIAEYKQLALRYKALANMCIKWDNSELDFIPTCPREMYDDQLVVMKQYMNILEKRAEIENINLN